MKGLTSKEEEIMGFFWEKGPLFVKQMLAFYEDPKPHFNTLSTIVRGLEEKGYLAHEVYGNTSTANFISGMMKSVPPLNDLFNMAGLNLPTFLKGAATEEKTTDAGQQDEIVEEVEK